MVNAMLLRNWAGAYWGYSHTALLQGMWAGGPAAAPTRRPPRGSSQHCRPRMEYSLNTDTHAHVQTCSSTCTRNVHTGRPYLHGPATCTAVYYPEVKQILGQPVVRDLRAVQGQVDILDVFRRPQDLPQARLAVGACNLPVGTACLSELGGQGAGMWRHRPRGAQGRKGRQRSVRAWWQKAHGRRTPLAGHPGRMRPLHVQTGRMQPPSRCQLLPVHQPTHEAVLHDIFCNALCCPPGCSTWTTSWR